MDKYVKVMFGKRSGAKSGFEYKINEVNIANNWNPNAKNGKDFGGFNYADEKCILRWLHRGDTIYDVEVVNPTPSKELIEALKEEAEMINNPEKYPRYNNWEDLKESLLSDD